ncbi:anoctamin-4-like [Amblyomma americanum]
MDDNLRIAFRPNNQSPTGKQQGSEKDGRSDAQTNFSNAKKEESSRNSQNNPDSGTGALPAAAGAGAGTVSHQAVAEDGNKARSASDASALPVDEVAQVQHNSLRSLYFQDGERRIDFVLAYEKLQDPALEEHRRIFEENLRKEGLQLELEGASTSQDGKTNFLKIHAPWEVLLQYAEKLHLRLPIKKRGKVVDLPTVIASEGEAPVLPNLKELEEGSTELEFEGKLNALESFWARLCTPFPYDKKLIPDEKQFFTAEFVRQREGMHIMENKESVFSQAIRSRITWEVLMRTAFDESGKQTGIYRLLDEETYMEAYPLHDGPCGTGPFDPAKEVATERRLLYSEWARPASWYKEQPLSLIRRYFGEKTALYFAWLGFYTSMLSLPAAVGVLTTLYGLIGMTSNTPTVEICDRNIAGNIIMCPACNKTCPYDYLRNQCTFSMIVYIVDNAATAAFSVFMALWATLFMELWKRRQCVLGLQWNLAHIDTLTDVVYPEYEARATVYRLNPVTMTYEPYVPFWEKVARISGANSVVLLMLCLVVCSVFAIISYRIISVGWLSRSPQWRSHAHIATAITASLLNLVIILLMNKVYQPLATRLTKMERPRTQQEYEDSFTLKMFLFTFLNTYSSLIYIAFFKGRFSDHPGQQGTLLGYTLDKCAGGCLYEVSVQLAIVMVGKQVVNNIQEFAQLLVMNRWRSWQRKRMTRGSANMNGALARWEDDYVLTPWRTMSLFDEYLEMAVQFGFVTLFVAAFPLAPLFALLNNIVEIRLDAYKYTSQLRRPLAERVSNIGAWQVIVKGVSIFAVVCNAFQIAYTSDFIPRFLYRVLHSPDYSLRGFINFTLSSFDTSDFDNETRPDNSTLDGVPVRECRYKGFREPPGSNNEYLPTLTYWHIFAARLIFVVIFEHVVFSVTGLVAALIPDVPQSVQLQIKREQIVEQNAIAGLEGGHRSRSRRDSKNGSVVASDGPSPPSENALVHPSDTGNFVPSETAETIPHSTSIKC